MKKNILFAVFLLFVVAACVPDDDLFPETDDVEAYIGTWNVTDNSLKSLNYKVTIRKNPLNSSEILLDNFAGSSDEAVGIVTGKKVTILSQRIGNNWRVSGSGSYNSSTRLDFSYELEVAGDSESRRAIFSR